MPDHAVTTHWMPRSPWSGILDGGRLRRHAAGPGLIVEPQDGLGLASMIAPRAEIEAVSARVESGFGVALPTTPRIAEAAEIDFIWGGLGQWLARSARQDVAASLHRAVGDMAAIVDQSDSRAVLRLGGPRVREVLAKGCMIDLHPRAFGPGDVALSSIGHIGVHLWRQGEDTFEIAVFRSLAGSFWSWLQASAAEFGLEVAPASPTSGTCSESLSGASGHASRGSSPEWLPAPRA